MGMAHLASLRGTCNRLRVGAVLAIESRPISIGYNGAPSGHAHCGSQCNATNPCSNTLHAEYNAIWWARKHDLFHLIPKCTLYVTDSPCDKCAELITLVGIPRVVYDREYRVVDGINRLKDWGVEVVQCHVSLAANAN